MEKEGFLQNIHPTGKLLLTLLVAVFSMMLIVFLGLIVLIPFVGTDILNYLLGEMDLTHEVNMGSAKYIQFLSHLGLFIISSVLLAWWFGHRVSGYLFLNVYPPRGVLLLSILLVFASLPFINYLLELNMQMSLPDNLKGLENWMRQSEEMAEKVTRSFLNVSTWQGLLANLFIIAVIPAIGEELMFRGVLLRIFGQWTSSTHWAVWITAIIFSAIHMQFFGFFPRLALGVFFGYLVIWSGSLWPAIVAHFVNNAAAVVFYFLYYNKVADNTFETLGKGTEGLYYAFISMILIGIIMWNIRRRKQSRIVQL